MNLNGESADWDNLQKNVDLVIADVSEDYGWNFLLFYGVMGEPVEVVGKRKKIIEVQYRRLEDIIPFEWALAIPRKMEFEIELPLGIFVVDTFVLEHALGVPKIQEMEMEIPFSHLRYSSDDLEISIPLAVFRTSSIDFEIPLGKTLKGSIKKLKKLKKSLEELDKA